MRSRFTANKESWWQSRAASRGTGQSRQHGADGSQTRTPYLRFGAILTAMVVVCGVMCVSDYEWGHLPVIESRVVMALTMGGPAWSRSRGC